MAITLLLLLLLLLAMSVRLGLAENLSDDWEGLGKEEKRGVLAWLGLLVVVNSVEEVDLCPADLCGRDIVMTRKQGGVASALTASEVAAAQFLPGEIKLSMHSTATLIEDATLSIPLCRMLHVVNMTIAQWRRKFTAQASRLQSEIEAPQPSMSGERPLQRRQPANASDERPSRRSHRTNIYGERPSRRSHRTKVSDERLSRRRGSVPRMAAARDRSERGFEQQTEEISDGFNGLAIPRTRLSVRLPGSDVGILCRLLLRECTATHGGGSFLLQFGYEVKAGQETVLQHVNVLLPQTLQDPITHATEISIS